MKTSNQIRFVRAIAIAAFAFSFTTGAVAGTATTQVLERVQIKTGKDTIKSALDPWRSRLAFRCYPAPVDSRRTPS
jgi:hypothetical protein